MMNAVMTDTDRNNVAVTKGWIYILTNTAMPNFVKIGKTKRSPEERAAEISIGTGVVGTYMVFNKFPVCDIDHAETLVFHLLKEKRVQENREFFDLKPEKAQQLVEGCVNSINALHDTEAKIQTPQTSDELAAKAEAKAVASLRAAEEKKASSRCVEKYRSRVEAIKRIRADNAAIAARLSNQE
jgi:hypothetical protein